MFRDRRRVSTCISGGNGGVRPGTRPNSLHFISCGKSNGVSGGSHRSMNSTFPGIGLNMDLNTR